MRTTSAAIELVLRARIPYTHVLEEYTSLVCILASSIVHTTSRSTQTYGYVYESYCACMCAYYESYSSIICINNNNYIYIYYTPRVLVLAIIRMHITAHTRYSRSMHIMYDIILHAMHSSI